MDTRSNIERRLQENMKEFHLPRYQDLPDVGLFLEQTVRLINQYLEPLGIPELTSSMVSNYVKQKLIAASVKKQYGRDQIACLIFIAIAKTVLTLDDIRLMFALQKESYTEEVAYSYFCEEFDNVLQATFGIKSEMEQIGSSNSQVKRLLRAMIITVATRICFEKFMEEVKREL